PTLRAHDTPATAGLQWRYPPGPSDITDLVGYDGRPRRDAESPGRRSPGHRATALFDRPASLNPSGFFHEDSHFLRSRLLRLVARRRRDEDGLLRGRLPRRRLRPLPAGLHRLHRRAVESESELEDQPGDRAGYLGRRARLRARGLPGA